MPRALLVLLLPLLCLLTALPARAESPALDWLVGSWDTAETFPETGKTARGSIEFRWVLDGAFLQEEYRSDWPDGPYRGTGYMRWNPEAGQLDLWWFDAAGAQQHSRCPWDGRGPRVFLTIDGAAVVRETYTRTGPDEYTYRMERDEGSGYRTTMDLVGRRRR